MADVICLIWEEV
jgi:hypothetical protein